MPIRYPTLAALLLLSATACKRDNDTPASGAGASVLFGNASPEALEALSISVDYRLTDDSFARWEAAQRNLDRLPASAIPAATTDARGNVIDRAVVRLESSPRARTAIEASGLTVRDFVVQTIALAQAAEAADNGRVDARLVPAGNLRFVTRYRQRTGPRRTARASTNALSADSQSIFGQEMAADTLSGASASADSNHTWLGQSPQTQRGADSVEAERRGPEPPPSDTSDSLSVD